MDLEKIKSLSLAPINHSYDKRDTILYALGLGYGANPLDEAELPFVFEDGLRSVPSICCILAHPGFWLKEPEYRADWVKILHAEQAFEIHSPMPATGSVRGEYRVSGVFLGGHEGYLPCQP